MEDTTIEPSFQTFEDFYAKKDYANALISIQKLKKVVPPANWHYNIGTVYAKLENLPMARFHLLQAEALGFAGSEASQNLDLVEAKLEITKLEKPLNTIDYGVKAGLILQRGLLTSFSLLIILTGLIVLKKKPSFLKVTGLSLIALLPLALNWWINSWPFAVVQKNVELQEGPSAIFGSLGEVPGGVRVLYKNEGEWSQIIYPTRFNGWIKSNELKDLGSI